MMQITFHAKYRLISIMLSCWKYFLAYANEAKMKKANIHMMASGKRTGNASYIPQKAKRTNPYGNIFFAIESTLYSNKVAIPI